MQKKSKTLKKGIEAKASLARSLSARISPLSLGQISSADAFPINFTIRRGVKGPSLQIPMKSVQTSGNATTLTSNYVTKRSSDKNLSYDKKQKKKNERVSVLSMDLQEKNSYLKNLKKEVLDVISENKKFEKMIEEKKSHESKSLGEAIQNFKTKLQNKLTSH